MDNKPLVSIITPCYNGERYLVRFLESILAQTYSRIELIFVNDGSSDKTEDMVLSYRERFIHKGIELKYIFQENRGLGGAINTGLKHITGKYLCWPDADDYLETESVELRAKVLEDNPEYAIVTSDAYIRTGENDLSVKLVSESFKTNHDPDQFVHLLNGESILCSGTHLVRSVVFFETHPSGQIFPSKRGQNYQMLLPVYYGHKRYFLKKPLYNYMRHGTGMSQYEAGGFEARISTYTNQKEIILATLNSMKLSAGELTDSLKIVEARFGRILFNVAYDYQDYDLLIREFERLKSLDNLSCKQLMKYAIAGIKNILRSSKRDSE